MKPDFLKTTLVQLSPTAKLDEMPADGISGWGFVSFFVAVVAVSTLGAAARLLNDYSSAPISKKIVATYIVTGFTAGIIISLLIVEEQGFSYLLLGISGLAGFGSVQILAILAEGLQKSVKFFSKLLGGKSDE